MRARRLLVGVVAVVLVGAGCEYDPAVLASNPAFSECAGVPATIGIGWHENEGPDADGDRAPGTTYYGTEGDDVVVITNGPVTFSGLGGDDLICINDTTLPWGEPHAGRVVLISAGAGDDVVHNLSSYTRPGSDVTDIQVYLGGGSDVYHGGPASEYVATCGFWCGDLDDGDVDQIFTRAGDDGIFISTDAGVADCGEGHDWYTGPEGSVTNCEVTNYKG